MDFSEYFDKELRSSFGAYGEALSTGFQLLEERRRSAASLLMALGSAGAGRGLAAETLKVEQDIIAAMDRYCLASGSTLVVVVPDLETRTQVRDVTSACVTAVEAEPLAFLQRMVRDSTKNFDFLYVGGDGVRTPGATVLQFVAAQKALKSGAVVMARGADALDTDLLDRYVAGTGGTKIDRGATSGLRIWEIAQ